MSEHFFGVGRGKVTQREVARIERAIRSSGVDATFVQYNDPAEGPRFWFAVENLGSPFNERRAREVMAAVGDVKKSKGKK